MFPDLEALSNNLAKVVGVGPKPLADPQPQNAQPDIYQNIGNTLNSVLGGIGQGVSDLMPTSNYHFTKDVQAAPPAVLGTATQAIPAQLPQQSPSPTPMVSFMPQAQNDPNLAETIKQGIENWGGNTPLTDHINTLVQAAQMLPKNIDPYLPAIMALRETQGGRDLIDPQKAQYLGNNNIYNLAGDQPGNSKRFINYPDVATAIMGGPNDNGGQSPVIQSHGLIGTILNDPNYEDFRKSGDLHDLFKHWSPPTDNNGSLDEQVQNYNYIRNFFTKGKK